MSPYHFEPHFSPHASAPLGSHATQLHVPQGYMHANIGSHLPGKQPYSTALSHQPTPAPEHTAPLNRYQPDATVKTIADGHTVSANKQLKPGEVVEVTRPGHQAELQYVTYGGHLARFNESTISHVPNEIRDHIKKVGGPSYFAHELHNRLPTRRLYGQFTPGQFHGPNKPLI